MKRLLFFIALMLFNLSFSQNSSLSGKVADSKGNAIVGANVVVEKASKSTVTDADGNYSISGLSDGSASVSVSFIGLATQKKSVNISGKTTLDFQMQDDANSLEEVVVTGVVNPKAKLKSSVSITTLDVKQVEQSAPRSTAEIFRTIPGIRSESSGGEGNANIAVRGVPISSGGSKYLQIQEDGLPVLLYGDIAFATADIFTRFDRNIAKIEAIRGGSASTLSSNSPGELSILSAKRVKRKAEVWRLVLV